MKILFFTKYTRKGASSRLRSFQYLPLYEKQGHICTVQSLFDDKYLNHIYSKKPVKKLIIFAYLRRLINLHKILSHDVIIIEKELFPYLPAWFEWLMNKMGIEYFVDYDDAIFHTYDLSKNFFINFFLRNKIDKVMKQAFHVICGNEYLAERARKAGAKKISVVPTVVDLQRYSIKEFKISGPVVIGWIGTPFTSRYVLSIKEALYNVSHKHSIKLNLVGLTEGIGLNQIEELSAWSEETEVELIKSFDIGIMPLIDNEWEKGKCGYKLIQYMASGLPVVASPVGVNNQIVKEGSNGFKAATLTEWEEKITKLISDVALRYNMGLEGRKMVENEYNLDKQFLNWLSIING